MRLLVTRPAMDAAALADLLAAQGHDVLISPMIHIELNAVELPDATAHGGLALTSANGVRALMAHLAQLPNAQRDAQMAAWAARPAFAVGPQTAAALQAAGFQNIHQADGDVDALIDLIVADYEADDAVDDEWICRCCILQVATAPVIWWPGLKPKTLPAGARFYIALRRQQDFHPPQRRLWAMRKSRLRGW
jgi:hypothetical protein